jgi:hypothetical protein
MRSHAVTLIRASLSYSYTQIRKFPGIRGECVRVRERCTNSAQHPSLAVQPQPEMLLPPRSDTGEVHTSTDSNVQHAHASALTGTPLDRLTKHGHHDAAPP